MKELNFKEFLNEGPRGFTKGAFGKSVLPQGRPQIDDTSSDYTARINAGKSLEQEIRLRLEELGIITTNSNFKEDTQLGIDGYILSNNGGKTNLTPPIPFQMKARKTSSGNDILWETIKPWNESLLNLYELQDQSFTGKDMRCKAKILFALANDGKTIRVRKIAETIDIAKKMTTLLIQEIKKGRTSVNTKWGQARLTIDPSQQATFNQSGTVKKINCYIMPGAYEWKQELQLKTNLGEI